MAKEGSASEALERTKRKAKPARQPLRTLPDLSLTAASIAGRLGDPEQERPKGQTQVIRGNNCTRGGYTRSTQLNVPSTAKPRHNCGKGLDGVSAQPTPSAQEAVPRVCCPEPQDRQHIQTSAADSPDKGERRPDGQWDLALFPVLGRHWAIVPLIPARAPRVDIRCRREKWLPLSRVWEQNLCLPP